MIKDYDVNDIKDWLQRMSKIESSSVWLEWLAKPNEEILLGLENTSYWWRAKEILLEKIFDKQKPAAQYNHMKITLDLTKEECQIIRDALTKRILIEDNYQRDLLRATQTSSVSNLMELSDRQRNKMADLQDQFSSLFMLTKWNQ